MFCSKCGIELKSSVQFCKNCGNPMANDSQKKQPSKGLWVLISSVLVFFFFVSVCEQNKAKIKTDKLSYYGSKKYIHQPVNIRSGRGTEYSILNTLQRGTEIYVDSLINGWYAIVNHYNGNATGYIYANLVKSDPIPEIEIVSWSWRADPDYGVGGSVIYSVELRNNTYEYIRSVKVEFSTYDVNNNLMDSDYTYVSGLSPGGTASTKSFATYFGNEYKAKIRIAP